MIGTSTAIASFRCQPGTSAARIRTTDTDSQTITLFSYFGLWRTAARFSNFGNALKEFFDYAARVKMTKWS